MAVKKLAQNASVSNSSKPAITRKRSAGKKPFMYTDPRTGKKTPVNPFANVPFWRPEGFIVGVDHDYNTGKQTGRFDLNELARRLKASSDFEGGGQTIMSMIDLAEGYAEVAWRFNPERDPETGKGYPDPTRDPNADNDPAAWPGMPPAKGGADDPRVGGMKACFVALMTNRPIKLPWDLLQHCCKAYSKVLFEELKAEAEKAMETAKEAFANPPELPE